MFLYKGDIFFFNQSLGHLWKHALLRLGPFSIQCMCFKSVTTVIQAFPSDSCSGSLALASICAVFVLCVCFSFVVCACTLRTFRHALCGVLWRLWGLPGDACHPLFGEVSSFSAASSGCLDGGSGSLALASICAVHVVCFVLFSCVYSYMFACLFP